MTSDYDLLTAELAKYGKNPPAIHNMHVNTKLARSVKSKMRNLNVTWSLTLSGGYGILNYYNPNDRDSMGMPYSTMLEDLPDTLGKTVISNAAKIIGGTAASIGLGLFIKKLRDDI